MDAKKVNGSGNGTNTANEWRVKVGLAEMLKGGVIMDVTNAEQAQIAEKAGACAVMALERVPSDIRKEGGVARMAPINKIREIMHTVSIPVMAKARIGHFMEARILEAEQELAAIRAEMHAPDVVSDATRLQECYRGMQSAEARVEELYARWAELEAKQQ